MTRSTLSHAAVLLTFVSLLSMEGDSARWSTANAGSSSALVDLVASSATAPFEEPFAVYLLSRDRKLFGYRLKPGTYSVGDTLTARFSGLIQSGQTLWYADSGSLVVTHSVRGGEQEGTLTMWVHEPTPNQPRTFRVRGAYRAIAY